MNTPSTTSSFDSLPDLDLSLDSLPDFNLDLDPILDIPAVHPHPTDRVTDAPADLLRRHPAASHPSHASLCRAYPFYVMAAFAKMPSEASRVGLVRKVECIGVRRRKGGKGGKGEEAAGALLS
mmetsp:Transcript_12458/g.31458  ORF Transcript_12458/g.31458 Transcript_12458/m.31458 type:complete len:123 (+) Transcript_12458:172-540(+)